MLPDESVHCVVTSPPYWMARDYDVTGQMGREDTLDEHLSTLLEVLLEVRRVLRRDGVVWLNYGDSYAASGKGQSSHGLQRNNAASLRLAKHHTGWRAAGYKPKDRMLIGIELARALHRPWLRCVGCGHVAHAISWGYFPDGRAICPACIGAHGVTIEVPGWWLRQEVIWDKGNPSPESALDRPTTSHEKVFLLAKEKRYAYDAEAVRTKPKKDWGQRAGLAPTSWDTGKGSHGHVHKDGRRAHDNGSDQDGKVRGHHREHRGLDTVSKPVQQAAGANLRSVWRFGVETFRGAHFATFPRRLAETCIKAGTSAFGVCAACGTPHKRLLEVQHVPRDGSPPGDAKDSGSKEQQRLSRTVGSTPQCNCETDIVPATVLDPFGGAGTTALAAEVLGRNSISIEINPTYVQIANNRLQEVSLPQITQIQHDSADARPAADQGHGRQGR